MIRKLYIIEIKMIRIKNDSELLNNVGEISDYKTQAALEICDKFNILSKNLQC